MERMQVHVHGLNLSDVSRHMTLLFFGCMSPKSIAEDDLRLTCINSTLVSFTSSRIIVVIPNWVYDAKFELAPGFFFFVGSA